MKNLLRILTALLFCTFFFEANAAQPIVAGNTYATDVNYRPTKYKEVLAFFESHDELEQKDWNYVLHSLEIFLRARPNMNGTERMEFFEKEGEDVYTAYWQLLMAAGAANTIYINREKSRYKEQAKKAFNDEQKKWYDKLVKDYRLKE